MVYVQNRKRLACLANAHAQRSVCFSYVETPHWQSPIDAISEFTARISQHYFSAVRSIDHRQEQSWFDFIGCKLSQTTEKHGQNQEWNCAAVCAG